MIREPHITCHRLPEHLKGNMESLLDFTGTAQPVSLCQAWLASPEPGFLPADVRVTWSPEALLVFAVLPDRDIFTNATAPNQETWLLGDVFEIFLQGELCTHYVELHITPTNLRTQFYFERSGAPRMELPDGVFASDASIDSRNARWTVLAEIPARLVNGRDTIKANEQWHFSFSRYDASRDGNPPVLSSTSQHTRLNFHRLGEWGSLIFV